MSNMLFDMLEKVGINKGVNKKLILWPAGYRSRYIFCACRVLDIEIAYFIDNNKEKQENKYLGIDVYSPYQVLYENPEEFIVLSLIPNQYDISRQINELGLIEGKNYLDLNKKWDSFFVGAPFNLFDPSLGYSRVDDIEGFTIYGDKNDDNLNIAILGGSTTDSTFSNIRSWPQFLYEKFCESNKRVTIFNGGMCGYCSSQEMIKLIRDCLSLKPDIIISFTGINDVNWILCNETYSMYTNYLKTNMEKTFQTAFKKRWTEELVDDIGFGIKPNLSDYENWFKNMKIMHGIAKEFEIKFLSFLQPTIFYGGYNPSSREKAFLKYLCEYVYDNPDTPESQTKLLTGAEKFYTGAVRLSKGVDYIYDITDIFDGQSEIFYDIAHCNEIGNKLIANRIFAVLQSML